MKRLIALMMCAMSLGAAAQLPDYVPADGLVAWYALDGDAFDKSGQGYDGQIISAESQTNRFGMEEGALNFSSNSDEAVDLPDMPVFPNFSFSFWVRLNTIPNGVDSWIYGDWLNGGFGIVIDADANNQLYVHVDDIGLPTNDNGSCTSNYYFELGEWVHVVILRENGSVSFWVDGELYSTLTDNSVNPSNSDGLARIGTSFTESQPFSGDIDDFGFWSRALTEDEILELFQPVLGCKDPEACNFNPEADIEDGTCASCEALSTACGDGTIWDPISQSCISANTADINNDGCVQLNDLLDLLSAYGNCGAEESPWQCGDPLEYQGYEYATVPIGEQCWFAENLRAENYKNGDFIPANLDNSEWTSTTSGATVFYGDDVSNLQAYGRLYNWHAVDDARSLCPNAWRIPSDGDWTVLTNFLGGSATAGAQMKTTYGWNGDGDGANSSGFSGLPGGSRASNGNFYLVGSSGYWWSSSPYGSSAWYRTVSYNDDSVNRNFAYHRNGYSVRCVQDAQ